MSSPAPPAMVTVTLLSPHIVSLAALPSSSGPAWVAEKWWSEAALVLSETPRALMKMGMNLGPVLGCGRSGAARVGTRRLLLQDLARQQFKMVNGAAVRPVLPQLRAPRNAAMDERERRDA